MKRETIDHTIEDLFCLWDNIELEQRKINLLKFQLDMHIKFYFMKLNGGLIKNEEKELD